MAQQTQINGSRYSFVNITTVINGTEQPRVFKSINYDAMQDAGNVQGNSVGIVGRTDGYGTSTGNFEMYVSESDDLNNDISAEGTFPLLSRYFDMSVSYSVNDDDVRTDVLLGCRITKQGSSNQSGNDASSVTYELNIARMTRNGILMYGDPDNA